MCCVGLEMKREMREMWRLWEMSEIGDEARTCAEGGDQLKTEPRRQNMEIETSPHARLKHPITLIDGSEEGR